MSHAARLLLASRRSIMEERGELRAASTRETAILRKAVSAALNPSIDSPPVSVMLTDASSNQPVEVLATRCRDGHGQARALIVVGARSLAASNVSHELRSRFGLTQTEAAIALQIAEGLSLPELAAVRHNSEETLKTHLKSIFTKTGVHSQAALVSLVLRLPGSVVRPGDFGSD
jgi:DNA-binding CsgD family transcriptional regulator